ncbi:MAG: hypothetical protein Q9162_005127 [Coniocarpon cinnabarinum]
MISSATSDSRSTLIAIFFSGVTIGSRARDSFRTHAEAAVSDTAYAAEIASFDGKQRIAHGKESCFCYYRYITHHLQRSTRPSFHDKLLLNWRSPNLTRANVKSLEQQSNTLDQVTREMTHAAIDETFMHFNGLNFVVEDFTIITESKITIELVGSSDTGSSDGEASSDDEDAEMAFY